MGGDRCSLCRSRRRHRRPRCGPPGTSGYSVVRGFRTWDTGIDSWRTPRTYERRDRVRRPVDNPHGTRLQLRIEPLTRTSTASDRRTLRPIPARPGERRSAVMAFRRCREAVCPRGLRVIPCACGTANVRAVSCAHERARGALGSPRRARSRSIAPWEDAKRPGAARSAVLWAAAKWSSEVAPGPGTGREV